MSLRHVQSAALAGLLLGTALLIYGMTGGGLLFALLGMLLGMTIGVPAGVANFWLQGYTFDMRLLKAAFGMDDDPRPNLPAPDAAPPAAINPPTPAPQLPPTVPPTVPQSVAVVVPPDPPPPRLSHAERQAIIDEVQRQTVVALVMGYANHEDELVRLYAVQRLGALGDVVAQSALQAALNDPAEVVQRAARLALNRLNPTES